MDRGALVVVAPPGTMTRRDRRPRAGVATGGRSSEAGDLGKTVGVILLLVPRGGM